MENKFLCQIKWITYECQDEDHYQDQHLEVKEMTVLQMNEFVKSHIKPDIKILKEIIPTKTLNQKPIFNKVDGLLEKILSNSRKAYNSMNKRIVTIELDKLRELIANGETPEEANPVGQVKIREIYYSKTASVWKFYGKDKDSTAPVRKDDIKLIEINCTDEVYYNIIIMLHEISKLYFNKPLETTKEQSICSCKTVKGSSEAISCCKMKNKPYTGTCVFD